MMRPKLRSQVYKALPDPCLISKCKSEPMSSLLVRPVDGIHSWNWREETSVSVLTWRKGESQAQVLPSEHCLEDGAEDGEQWIDE